MKQNHVNVYFDTLEDAERRAEYHRQSGGFVSVVVMRVRGGVNDGRWLVRSEREEGMDA